MRIPIFKIDLIIVLCISMIVLLSCVIINEVYITSVNECTASSLTYSIEQFEKEYKNADAHGIVYIMADSTTPGVRVLESYKFNSTSIEAVG